VLYQLGVLLKDVTEIRQLLDRQSAGSYYADENSLPVSGVEVRRGPMQSVQAVTDLSARCKEANICQFLVC